MANDVAHDEEVARVAVDLYAVAPPKKFEFELSGVSF